ncbi:MAG TPA: helix-turn-helix domain-containing protein [Myxococcales bacterium]
MCIEGLTLKQVQEMAVVVAWQRTGGNVRQMCRTLGISRAALTRRLNRYGLRGTISKEGRPNRLSDGEIARVFRQHRILICAELRCADAVFVRWLNRAAPFTPDAL